MLFTNLPSKMSKTCWVKNKLINDILLWTTIHGHSSLDQPTKIYISHLCIDTRCCVEDLLKTVTDRDGWQERVKQICVLTYLDDDDSKKDELEIVLSLR